MRFLPPEEEVKLYETGFGETDLLGRIGLGKKLSEVVDRIEDPLVIALDGSWGTGKSWFLQRWVGEHTLQNDGKALTVHFDAFSHDYLTDPLTALVSTLASRIEPGGGSSLAKVKRLVFDLAKPAARMGLAVATSGVSEVAGIMGGAALEVARGEADKAMEGFWKREEGRRAAMKSFQRAVEELTFHAKEQNRRPIVIVIDELDRCRPDYALEVLEVIKHFFSVPRVHFVLGANLDALQNSVKARYGSEIDASMYLSKFVSITMSLPDHIGDPDRTPATIKYLVETGRNMVIPDPLLNEIRDQVEVLLPKYRISIRESSKILSSSALLPAVTGQRDALRGWRTAATTLLIMKVVQPRVFRLLLGARSTTSELMDLFGIGPNEIKPNKEDGSHNREFYHRAYVLLKTWDYICSNGSMEGEDRESFAKAFDSFRVHQDVRRIPKKIAETWLDTFSIPSTGSS
jgi:hypothetical protein